MNYNLYNNILYKVDHAKYTPHNNKMEMEAKNINCKNLKIYITIVFSLRNMQLSFFFLYFSLEYMYIYI